LTQINTHLIIGKERIECGAETWFYTEVVDWIVRCGRRRNASAVVLRKGRGLNELNDWQCEVCRFTGKS